jgi:hypothetical protein
MHITFSSSELRLDLSGMPPDLAPLLPALPDELGVLHFKDSYIKFANGIRRALLDEIPVQAFTLDSSTPPTITDSYIIEDNLGQNIEMCPIVQDVLPPNARAHLSVSNLTETSMPITLDMVRIVHGGASSSASSSNWTPYPRTIIGHLKPGTRLHCNLRMQTACAAQNGRHAALNSVTWEMPGLVMYGDPDAAGEESKVRSMEMDPSEFRITFRTKATMSARRVVEKLCDALLQRLAAMREHVVLSKTPDYVADDFRLVKQPKTIELQFMNDYITIVGMVSQRISRDVPTIAYVSGHFVDPSSATGCIAIAHPEWNTIVLQGMDGVREDIELLRKAAAA